MSKTVDLIAGARPNFMKIAPIIRALNASGSQKMTFRLVHTGQHYDKKLSQIFFEQLEIPEPDINLGVGSGTQAQQTGAIMKKYEDLLSTKTCDLCLVVGDVTSTMACALVAKKSNIPVAHVEAGIRSGDLSMPEEINRLVTDSITDWFFTTSEHANANLIKSGVDPSCIFFVGNTMIDTLLDNLPKLSPPDFWSDLDLEKGKYVVVTLHRPSNVDCAYKLSAILESITLNANGLPVIFPVHPRTEKILKDISVTGSNLVYVEPQPYFQFNFLVQHAMAVVTDSGGITEETTVMKVPCMTMRDNTERPETVEMGTNVLLGATPAALPEAFAKLFSGQWKVGNTPPKWDGQAATRIIAHLEEILS